MTGWRKTLQERDDAQATYEQAARDIRGLLRFVEEALARHEGEEKHWGHVGDLQDVRQRMLDVAMFLGAARIAGCDDQIDSEEKMCEAVVALVRRRFG